MTAELLAELASAGYPCESLADLRRSGLRYREAVPVLLAWLPLAQSPGEREEIVRALSVPWARPAALGPLIEQFRAEPVPGNPQEELLRWAVGNALEVVWDDSRFDDLVGLARDERFGKARELVVLGLAKSRRPEAPDVLTGLLDDRVVDGHAAQALRKRKAAPPPAARPALERLTTDRRPWARKEAARALALLDT